MSNNTKISWTSISWNIMTGCTPISDGCNDCYAKAMVKRLQAMGQAKYQNGFTPTIHPECMNEPFWWKGNKLEFVASMGDFIHIAKKFDNTGVGVEDLISIGTIGLIKAINTFNPSKKIKLATYASRCIENEILMYLRRNSKTKMEVSIDEPLNVDWDGNELLLSDILGTEEDTIYRDLEDEAERKILFRALNKLSGREKLIVRMRFGLDHPEGKEMTQKEVADQLGISQSYISRLEKKIMHRLRMEMVRYE